MIIKGSVMELMALKRTLDSISLAMGEPAPEELEIESGCSFTSIKMNMKHGIHIEIKEEFVLELYGLYARVGEKILPLIKPLVEAFGLVQEDIQEFVDKWE